MITYYQYFLSTVLLTLTCLQPPREYGLDFVIALGLQQALRLRNTPFASLRDELLPCWINSFWGS